MYINGAGYTTVMNGTSVLANLPTGSCTDSGMAFDPSTGMVYVSNCVREVVINGTQIMGSVAAGDRPGPVVYDPGSATLWVSDTGVANVSEIGVKGPIALAFNQTAVANATNVTLSWQVWPSRSSTTVSFGNATYGITANGGFSQTATPSSGGLTKTFVDFLEPNTTYLFRLNVSDAGFASSVSGGRWTTTLDGLYHTPFSGYYINGTIANQTKASVPTNLRVSATCSVSPWVYNTSAGGSGAFSLFIPFYGTSKQSACELSGGRFIITAWSESSGYGHWYGNWNESVVIWAPEILHFILPQNNQTRYIYQIVDYSNANSTNGLLGWTSLNAGNFTTYSTTETDCSTYLFVFGHCSGSSNNTTYGSHFQSTVGNLVVSQRFMFSGDLLYDAINRSVWAATFNMYEPSSQPWNNGSQPAVDNLTPSTYRSAGGYILTSYGKVLSNGSLDGVNATYGNRWGGQVSVANGREVSGVQKELQISMDFSYYGIGVGIGIIDLSWSQVQNATRGGTISWYFTPPAGHESCNIVFGYGGSQSANNAVVIGVWTYPWVSGAGSNGCVLPP